MSFRLSALPWACLCITVGLSCSDDKRSTTEQGDITPPSGDGDDDSAGEGSDSTERLDLGEGETGGPGEDPDGDDESMTNQIDILFVIDSSGSTGQEQLALAHNFPLLIQQLQNLTDDDGDPVSVDVQIMVTTTDMAHPNCAGATSGVSLGRPATTACTTRLGDFIFNGQDWTAACTDACPQPVVPEDPFLWFYEGLDNVPGDPAPNDVNGDGVLDDAAAQALACVGPQGVAGCWFESPLDAMMAAISPDAPHNQGENPFVRKGAVLAVGLLTDEADCSIDEAAHPDVFDPNGSMTYWNVDPTTGQQTMSSGVCWNAGVDCDDNGDGTYDCEPTNEPLVDVEEYKEHLEEMILDDGKEVVMLGIIGVPVVTEHDPEPPHLPTEGGVEDLVYRDAVDGVFPNGDILPDEQNVENAADFMFRYSIGPGCTEYYNDTGGSQAVPAPRIIDVCQSLDKVGDDDDRVRCCIESICDDDYSAAITCLTGLIGDVTAPPE